MFSFLCNCVCLLVYACMLVCECVFLCMRVCLFVSVNVSLCACMHGLCNHFFCFYVLFCVLKYN